MKPSAEQQFLYGNNVLKSGLGRITENTPKYQGVVVFSMSDLPLVSLFLMFKSVSSKLFPFQFFLISKAQEDRLNIN